MLREKGGFPEVNAHEKCDFSRGINLHIFIYKLFIMPNHR